MFYGTEGSVYGIGELEGICGGERALYANMDIPSQEYAGAPVCSPVRIGITLSVS